LLPSKAVKVPAHKHKVLVGKHHSDYRLLSLTKQGVIVRDISTGRGKFSSDMGTSQEVRNGDLVFCLFDVPETPRTVGLSRHEGMITGAYTVFEPVGRGNCEYFELFYRAMDDRKLLSPLYSGLRKTIPAERFLGTRTPQPPPGEQWAIVRFLDWANGRLERAILAKRKVIALLNEQKQAIIHRAVTRGLGPSAPLKSSGVPWLGDIPQHWEVMPIKRTCSLVRDGTHLPPARTRTGIPLLSVRNMVDGRLVRRPDDSFISKADFEKLNTSFVVRPNDVLMAIVGATLGKVALVHDIGPFQIQRSVSILRPRPELMSHDFLATFLRSPRLQQHLWQSVAFSAQPGIYLGFLANIPVPVPPTIDEQVSINVGLQLELSPISAAISRLEREIQLLSEYRTRLFADVVTGEVDVREAAAKLPAEPGVIPAPSEAPDLAEEDLEETLDTEIAHE
jgi:type I restriction enzyme S subunit